MFTINREALAKELGVIQAAAEKKSTIPILSMVLAELKGNVLRLTATDCDVRLSGELSAEGDDGSFCVSAKNLFSVVSLLESEELGFIVEDNERIRVTGGRSKHFLTGLPAKGFPSPDEKQNPVTFTLPVSMLLEAIQRTAFAVERQEGRWATQGIHLVLKEKKLTAVATTGAFMAVAEYLTDQEAETEVTLPTRGINALLGLLNDTNAESVTVSVFTNAMEFQVGSRTFSSRLLAGKFPNWEMVVPKTLNHPIRLDSEFVAAAMKRASITTGEFALVKKPLKLILSKSEMIIQSRESDEGYGYEPIAIQCESLNGDTILVGINAQNFLDFFNQAKGQSVTLGIKDADSQMLLTITDDPTYRFVTMPVTLKNW